ncbi:MAG: hypothetical protein HQ508_00155 [Candidatus Marinimicrobia bacterium]|nr:hypothetical protein [Candidatus Neomarinimicrobiota bacterium]
MNDPNNHNSGINVSQTMPDIWMKAAMLGSLWASIEIILGSFLHNLHIPLSGTFLASLGLILMINGYKLWPQKGLFWRTALVTAAMKSISPSAIIFGPMIGIFMEGLILELFVRLFKGRWIGFVIGGALAVSWSLLQKILVLTMTYGPDFIKLYEQLYLMAAHSLRFDGTAPVDLVKAIFLIDLCFGALVASLAFRRGKSLDKIILPPAAHVKGEQAENLLIASASQKFSLLLFFANLLLLVAGLALLDDLSLPIGAALVILYVSLNISRYARSLRRLKNPRLWIQLIAVMGLSGLILGGWDSTASILAGLQTGFGMAIRALLVIFGFSALSIEFRNPVIINWFSRRGMAIVFEALSIAFEVLPRLLKLVSQKKHLWRHPIKTLNQLLGALEILRQEHVSSSAMIVILTGNQGDGKTQLIRDLIDSSESSDIKFSGFYSEGSWLDGERDKYHIVDISNRSSALLCERDDPPSDIRSGPFNFRHSGIAFGCGILKDIVPDKKTVVVIDEIGPLELRDEGWGIYMGELVAAKQMMIWTVRPSLLDAVIAKWGIRFSILKARESKVSDIERFLRQMLS